VAEHKEDESLEDYIGRLLLEQHLDEASELFQVFHDAHQLDRAHDFDHLRLTHFAQFGLGSHERIVVRLTAVEELVDVHHGDQVNQEPPTQIVIRDIGLLIYSAPVFIFRNGDEVQQQVKQKHHINDVV